MYTDLARANQLKKGLRLRRIKELFSDVADSFVSISRIPGAALV
jgi:hypothetical protein